MQNSEIKTPLELFGVECDKGWYPLIQPLVDYIEKYNKDKSEDDKIEILQIKEKFGTLRFYTSYSTKELHDMICKAEIESANTCELCGTTNNVGQTSGWITTCCLDCAKKISNKKDRPIHWIDAQTHQKVWIHPNGDIEKASDDTI